MTLAAMVYSLYVVFAVAMLVAGIVEGARWLWRFLMALLAGTGADLEIPPSRLPVQDFDEDDHGLSWRMGRK